jgi:membrane associated rhomboid family serine protease
MDLVAVAGVSRLAAIGGVLVGVAAVIVLSRVLARRSTRRARTVVSLNGHD